MKIPSSPMASQAAVSAGWNPAPVTPVGAEPDLQWEADRTNPFRRLAFYFALAAVYFRFGVIPEFLSVILGRDTYILYLILPPAMLGVIATGGLRRTLRERSSRYWLAFTLWLLLASVFSSWRGGSLGEFYGYLKAELPMLFIVAGLVMTWSECKLMLYALALAGVTDVIATRLFIGASYRIELNIQGSLIGNSNDLAAHLILLMAFLLCMILMPKVPTVLRCISVPVLAFGVYLILGTGSRGALVALTVCTLFTFLVGSATYRVALIAAVPVAIFAMLFLLPQSTLQRLSTLTSEDTSQIDKEVRADAVGSGQMREALFKKSVEYTMQHPLFGVGLGQFSSYEGGESKKSGAHGMWHQTHNIFTQVSSECGIPALIAFVAAISSAFLLVFKTYRKARLNPLNKDITVAAFCVMLAIVGFMSAATFLNLAYGFYEPAFCGLCIALYTTAHREMTARQSQGASATPATPPWALPQPSGPFPSSARPNPAPVFSKLR